MLIKNKFHVSSKHIDLPLSLLLWFDGYTIKPVASDIQNVQTADWLIFFIKIPFCKSFVVKWSVPK